MRGEGGRLELAAVNQPAADAGLVPGLPLADARAILPALATRTWAPGEDARALVALAAWCGRYTPWAAVDGTCEAPGGGGGILLDVTGCAHLFGGEQALLADLVARLEAQGFTARAALAETIGAAWALARFATGPARPWRRVPPGGLSDALAPLPPAALRLPPAAVELSHRLGLTRIDALYGLPAATLGPRFGLELAERLRQALGEVPETLSPLQAVPEALARRVFAEPIATAEDIARGLQSLAVELCRRLEDVQIGARRLEATVYRVDGGLRRLSLGLSRASRDPAHLSRLFAGKIEQIDPGFGIEVLTLAATRTEGLTALQLLLGREDGGPKGFAESAEGGEYTALIDRLGARLGPARVVRRLPCESHLPERAERSGSALEAAPKTEGSKSVPPGSPARPASPRPVYLFSRPEAVEAVALLPDHAPARFRWRRLLHRVVRAEGPERIAAEWWRSDADRAEAARDYFRVEDQSGRRYWLYRADGRWFLHGLFA